MASSSCTVCGNWYAGIGIGRLDVCPDCFVANFSGNPLEGGAEVDPTAHVPLEEPNARDALTAFVCAESQVTRRQMQATARLTAQWLAAQED